MQTTGLINTNEYKFCLVKQNNIISYANKALYITRVRICYKPYMMNPNPLFLPFRRITMHVTRASIQQTDIHSTIIFHLSRYFRVSS